MGRVRKTVDNGFCGAKLPKKDGRCSLMAGFGTDHLGVGQCKYHGGKTKVGTVGAARPMLRQLTGMDVKIGPLDALLMCVRITAAEVAYFTAQIADLDPEDVVGRPVHEAIASTKDDWDIVDLKQGHSLNIWVRARQDATERLARYSAMALKAGVEERLVSMAESAGDKLANALQSILDELHLTPEQMTNAPAVVRRHLSLLEAGAA